MAEKTKRHHGIAIKPTAFAAGGKVFAMEDFKGITAETIQKRLKKEDVMIKISRARTLHEAINGKWKEEKKGGEQ